MNNDNGVNLIDYLSKELNKHAFISDEDARALVEILFKPNSNSFNMMLMDILENYKEERRLNEPDPNFIKAD